MRIQTEEFFVYVSTPKVCTHTIYQILETYYPKGLVKYGFHNNRVPDWCDGYYRWTCCRNPYSRAVSLWWSACRCHSPDRYGIIKGCGSQNDFTKFAEWLSSTTPAMREKEPLLMPQTEWIKPAEPISMVHVENLETELNQLPFWRDDIIIPQMNTTKEKVEAQSAEEGQEIKCPPWQDMYGDPRAKDAIRWWAEWDFERFGYEDAL